MLLFVRVRRQLFFVERVKALRQVWTQEWGKCHAKISIYSKCSQCSLQWLMSPETRCWIKYHAVADGHKSYCPNCSLQFFTFKYCFSLLGIRKMAFISSAGFTSVRWWRSCCLAAGHWGRKQPKALQMQPCWRWPAFQWATWWVNCPVTG